MTGSDQVVLLVELDDGKVVAVPFSSRERAEQWEAQHDYETVGRPPVISARSLGAKDELNVTPRRPLADRADASPEAQLARLHHEPWLRLLGPVGLQNPRGPEPRTLNSTTNRSAVNRATELLAFLTLNPGADYKQVHEAMWRGQSPEGKQAASNRNGLTTRARKWLGNDDGGRPYFPPVGITGYRLTGVISDWDVWRELVGETSSGAPTPNLIAALELAAGQPFSAVRDRYYVWAERIKQKMIDRIGDAAHELCTRSLATGDVSHARLAAAVGREVDPINEIFWRDALRTEHQAHDVAGLNRVLAQLVDQLEQTEGAYDPEPETRQLVDQIRGPRQLHD
jgi:hypothetical protein